MKRLISLILFACISNNVILGGLTVKWNKNFQDYFNKYRHLAIKQMIRYRIPASITLAQAVLESSAGNSKLAIYGNNHFGIKCHGWDGRTMTQDDDLNNECFRAYDTVEDSYEDHSKFLATRERYRSLFSLNFDDYKGWCYGLKKAGYATNPNYAQKLIALIELYQLYEYDKPSILVENRINNPINNITTVKINISIPKPLHRKYIFNDNTYIVANTGDTFYQISKEFDISISKLARYNECPKDIILNKGDIVWFGKKKHRAPNSFRGRPHIVRVGDSLYSISQLYGIRLKYLMKLNPYIVMYGIKVGDIVHLYE